MKKQAAPIVFDTVSLLDNMLLSFKRSCLARNLSHSTVISYVETIERLSNFLKAQGMPLDTARHYSRARRDLLQLATQYARRQNWPTSKVR